MDTLQYPPWTDPIRILKVVKLSGTGNDLNSRSETTSTHSDDVNPVRSGPKVKVYNSPILVMSHNNVNLGRN